MKATRLETLAGIGCFAVVGFLDTTARAQVNSWNNSANGTWKWEDSTKWSLGVPPAAGQSVYITNGVGAIPRSRTVMIDATTASSFPGTMTISNLTVAVTSPGIGFNTLFLNNAGLGTPLHVLNVLTNAHAITISNSVLQVGDPNYGRFWNDGSVLLNTGKIVTTNADSRIGFFGSGQMTVTEGTWLDGHTAVGAFPGAQGTLTVAGGTINVSSFFYIGWFSGTTGTVWLTGGQLISTNLPSPHFEIGSGGVGQMTVSNGTWRSAQVFVGTQSGSQGTLTIAGGTNTLEDMLVGGFFSGGTGTVWMTGGQLNCTNFASIVGYDGVGRMIVSNGTWRASYAYVGFDAGSQGTLTLAGGSNVLSSLTVSYYDGSTGAVWMTNGELISTNSDAIVGRSGHGQMIMSNGAWRARNIAVGKLGGSQGTLTLAGGSSSVYSNITVGDCGANGLGNVFVKGGGLFVTNTTHDAVCDLRKGSLTLSAGQLTIDTLVITNSCGHFFHGGGNLDVGALMLDPDLDADDDGLPNGWEETYGLDPLESTGDDGAAGDPDKDGLTNAEELALGTDPSVSDFRITAIEREADNIRVTWQTAGGRTNMLQATNGNGDGSYATNGFSNLGPQMVIGGSGIVTTNYTDFGGATNEPARYYRVRLVP
jgi:T5SS/PEP-CTERM-associated repeat protein